MNAAASNQAVTRVRQPTPFDLQAAHGCVQEADTRSDQSVVCRYAEPVSIPLPGGGAIRVRAKHDTFVDGREFIGQGIQPDIIVEPPSTTLPLGGIRFSRERLKSCAGPGESQSLRSTVSFRIRYRTTYCTPSESVVTAYTCSPRKSGEFPRPAAAATVPRNRPSGSNT